MFHTPAHKQLDPAALPGQTASLVTVLRFARARRPEPSPAEQATLRMTPDRERAIENIAERLRAVNGD